MGRTGRGNCGGQRRTCLMGCGKRIVGHPTRIQTLINLHYKKCELCKQDKHKLNLSNVPFDASENGVADLKSDHASHTYDRVRYNTFNTDTGETTKGEVRNTNLQKKETLEQLCPDAKPFEEWKKVEEYLEKKYGDNTTYLSKAEKEKLRKKTQKNKKKHKAKFQECLKVLSSGKDWIKLETPDLTERTANAVFSNQLPIPFWVNDEYEKKKEIPLVIGTKEEQLKYVWGDCVKSNFHYLWKDWKKTKGKTKNMWLMMIQSNEFRHEQNDTGEKWIVHHGAIDEGNFYKDFSNNRSIVMDFDLYTASGSGDTAKISNLGTYGDVEKQMKEMYARCLKPVSKLEGGEFLSQLWNGTDEDWKAYHTYYFLEILHQKLQIETNPDFYTAEREQELVNSEFVDCLECMVRCKLLWGDDEEGFIKDLEECYEKKGKVFYY